MARRDRESSSVMEILLDPIFGFTGAVLVIFIMQIIATINSVDQDLLQRLDQNAEQIRSLSGAQQEADLFKELAAGLQAEKARLEGLLQAAQQTLTARQAELEVQNVQLAQLRQQTAGQVLAEAADQALAQCRSRIATLSRELSAAKPPPLELRSLAVPPALVGRSYHFQFAAQGGAPPYSWTLTGGLPAGLDFDGGAGALRGVARAAATTPITVTVRDAASPVTEDRREYQLEVAEAGGRQEQGSWPSLVPWWFWGLFLAPLLLWIAFIQFGRWQFKKMVRRRIADYTKIHGHPPRTLPIELDVSKY